MSKLYKLVLDDGQNVIVSADEHHIHNRRFVLYRDDSEGTRQEIGAYVGLKGWHILETNPDTDQEPDEASL